jgi:D-alanyl-D-alanine carboxypeptidase/D-alanyl-D-alanine-endopeptidase (penicillin-binding protein 4)
VSHRSFFATTQAAKPAKAKKTKSIKAVSDKELAKRVDKLLAAPELQRGFWGVHVVDATTGKTIYEMNADRLFTPASNTKLFTTVTAMALLGPQYKVETTVETNGAIDSTGRLTGDLIVVGRGDPNISGRVMPYNVRTERATPSLRALEQLADSLVAAGLKHVEGDIVGDDSLFAYERYASGWGQDDLMWGDGAPASALTVNDNTIFVSFAPGNVGDKAKITVEPDVSYYDIDNRITTIPAGTGKRDIGMDRQPGSKTLVLWGTIPADDPGFNEALAIEDPAEFAAAAFKDMLAKRGVQITGKNRAQHQLTADLPIYALDVDKVVQHGEHGGAEPHATSPARTVLARLSSRPLIEDMVVTNKVSQNLHAELALRAVGKERGAANSLEAALAAEKTFLLSIGLDKEEFQLNDGSGMSGQNLVSPRAVSKLLLWTQRQPWADQFRQTLPLAGEDGTLDDRFRNSVAKDRVWAKTGTLRDTNALSGFAETMSGRKLVFAILVNHHRLTSSGAKKVVDHMLEVLVDDQIGRRTSRSARLR